MTQDNLDFYLDFWDKVANHGRLELIDRHFAARLMQQLGVIDLD